MKGSIIIVVSQTTSEVFVNLVSNPDVSMIDKPCKRARGQLFRAMDDISEGSEGSNHRFLGF